MPLLAEIQIMDFSWLSNPEAWIALLTLSVLEIVLGIDNIVFISILVDKLPPAQQARGRFLGLTLAMVMRIALLFSITWVMSLKNTLFTILGVAISGKDLILIIGGLFLLFKATHEIHEKLEGDPEGDVASQRPEGCLLRRDPRPDRAPGHRLLPRLRHHRGRHGGMDHRSWSSP